MCFILHRRLRVFVCNDVIFQWNTYLATMHQPFASILSIHIHRRPALRCEAKRCPLAKIICSGEQFAMGNGTAAAPPREAVALILHVRSAVSDQDLGAPRRRSAGRATHHLAHYPQCNAGTSYFRVLVRIPGSGRTIGPLGGGDLRLCELLIEITGFRQGCENPEIRDSRFAAFTQPSVKLSRHH